MDNETMINKQHRRSGGKNCICQQGGGGRITTGMKRIIYLFIYFKIKIIN